MHPDAVSKCTFMADVNIDIRSLSPALQTAYGYLEAGNWRSANDCFDLELKKTPLDPYVCLGKAMTAEYLKTPEELSYCTPAILENPFFSAALKYAEGTLKSQLTLLVVKLNYAKNNASPFPAGENAPSNGSDPAEGPEEFAVNMEVNEAEDAAVPGGTPARSNWSINDYNIITDEQETPSVENTGSGAPDNSAAANGELVFADSKKEKKKKRRKVLLPVLLTVLIVLAAGGGAAARLYFIPSYQYNKAIDLINAKKFDEGLAIMEELGDFGDAAEQYKTGLYVKALDRLANNDFESSKAIFTELGDFRDSAELISTVETRRVLQEVKTVADAEPGDTVTFGKFETDGKTENGDDPLTWTVLEKKNNKMTLITEQSIAAMRFHFNSKETCWEKSSLRAWLNGTFVTSAFDENESAFLCKNTVINQANPEYPYPDNPATQDKVYILSLSEATKYYSTAGERKAACSDASAPSTYTDRFGNCSWWLRTPGARLTSAVCVDCSGQTSPIGYDCYKNDQIGVRPVIVLDLSQIGD